jgi:formylglycine-generating enzyme required for sulfatase activity
MARVAGDYCPEVEHECREWLDPPEKPYARCGKYALPGRCKASKVALDFCIDRREYTPPGQELPQNQASLLITSRVCKSLGKRACTEREWNFACEGEEMRPYPYGWERLPVCNQDREDLYLSDPKKQVLADRRWPSGSRPDCVSPFGVFDMVGNLDEPVVKEPPGLVPFSNALKGGWWMPARNRCRPATTAHNDYFTGIQIGIRCCRNPDGSAP